MWIKPRAAAPIRRPAGRGTPSPPTARPATLQGQGRASGRGSRTRRTTSCPSTTSSCTPHVEALALAASRVTVFLNVRHRLRDDGEHQLALRRAGARPIPDVVELNGQHQLRDQHVLRQNTRPHHNHLPSPLDRAGHIARGTRELPLVGFRIRVAGQRETCHAARRPGVPEPEEPPGGLTAARQPTLTSGTCKLCRRSCVEADRFGPGLCAIIPLGSEFVILAKGGIHGQPTQPPGLDACLRGHDG